MTVSNARSQTPAAASRACSSQSSGAHRYTPHPPPQTGSIPPLAWPLPFPHLMQVPASPLPGGLCAAGEVRQSPAPSAEPLKSESAPPACSGSAREIETPQAGSAALHPSSSLAPAPRLLALAARSADLCLPPSIHPLTQDESCPAPPAHENDLTVSAQCARAALVRPDAPTPSARRQPPPAPAALNRQSTSATGDRVAVLPLSASNSPPVRLRFSQLQVHAIAAPSTFL